VGPEHQETVETMSVLATTLQEAGRFSEAEPLLRQTLEIQLRTLGPDHRVVLATTTSLGNTLIIENRFADAEKVFRQVIETQRRALGPEHPDTLNSMMSLGNALMEQGHYTEAEKVYLDTFHAEQRVLGPDHPDTAMTAYDLGCVKAHEGHKAEAISYLTQAVDHGLEPYGDIGMPNDPDLNWLHGDPRFTAVIAHAKEVAQTKQKPAPQRRTEKSHLPRQTAPSLTKVVKINSMASSPNTPDSNAPNPTTPGPAATEQPSFGTKHFLFVLLLAVLFFILGHSMVRHRFFQGGRVHRNGSVGQ